MYACHCLTKPDVRVYIFCWRVREAMSRGGNQCIQDTRPPPFGFVSTLLALLLQLSDLVPK